MSNEQDKSKFLSDVGQKAKIDRFEKNDTDATRWTNQLRDIGREMATQLTGYEYCGSACVHIYKSPMIGHVIYLSQTPLEACPEPIAGPAVSDLRNVMLQYYNRKPQRKRSGF